VDADQGRCRGRVRRMRRRNRSPCRLPSVLHVTHIRDDNIKPLKDVRKMRMRLAEAEFLAIFNFVRGH